MFPEQGQQLPIMAQYRLKIALHHRSNRVKPPITAFGSGGKGKFIALEEAFLSNFLHGGHHPRTIESAKHTHEWLESLKMGFIQVPVVQLHQYVPLIAAYFIDLQWVTNYPLYLNMKPSGFKRK